MEPCELLVWEKQIILSCGFYRTILLRDLLRSKLYDNQLFWFEVDACTIDKKSNTKSLLHKIYKFPVPFNLSVNRSLSIVPLQRVLCSGSKTVLRVVDNYS